MNCSECGGELVYGCGREMHVTAFTDHIDKNGPLAMDKFVDTHDAVPRFLAVGSPTDPTTEFVKVFDA